MKPLHASHHEQSKSSGRVVQRVHFFILFFFYISLSCCKITSLWQDKKKKQLSALSHFSLINLKCDKQLLLIVKGCAINLGRPISRGSASGRASLLGVFNKWMLKMRNFKSWPRIKRAFAAVTFRMTGHSVERVGKLLTRPVALANLTMKEPYLERTKHLITLSGSRSARCCSTSHTLYKSIIPFKSSPYFLLFLVAEVSQPRSSPFRITITIRMSLLSLLNVQRN